MRKFLVTIPLEYTKISMLDSHSFNANVELKMDENVSVHLEEIGCFSDIIDNETYDIKITTCYYGTQFKIMIEYIYADNERYASDMAECIASKICKVLTYLAQSQNGNPYYFHIKFYYHKRDIKIEEKKEATIKNYSYANGFKQIVVGDSISIREHLSIKETHTLDVKDFHKIFCKSGADDATKLMFNYYYKALGDIEPSSQYYNLFTIIEYIEKNDKDFAQAIFIVGKDECDKIIEQVKNTANTMWQKESNEIRKKYYNRLISSISQDIQRMTDLTRAEKLSAIIKNKYKIDEIKNPCFQFKITPDKMKEFIELRNKLFHGGKMDGDSDKKIVQLSNELLLLCQEIISKEINRDGV